MPDQPVSEGVQPGSEVGPPGVGVAVVGWRWMGSTGPLFLRVAGQIERFGAGNGLVRVRHGKGVFVAAPDEGERALQRFSRLREVGLEELFAMREVLEVPAAGWAAAEASDEQLASLIATFEQHEQAVRAQAGPERLRVVDARLHLQIAEYANNRFLTMTQSLLQEMLGRSMDPTLSVAGRPARSVREHAEVVNA